jgi:hypothetical protein
MTSYWRLDKTFKRYLKLYKYYPITSSTNEVRFSKLSDVDILTKIRKSIIHNSNYIVVGAYAYNYYVSKINKKDLIKVNFYEIITEDIKLNCNKIYKTLKKQFGSKITIKEYTPFFEFFDYRVEFLYEGIVILRVYNNNNRCIVYNESDKKKTKFGTNQIVLLYLLSNYNYYLINRNTLESNNYLNMFIKLNDAKNKFLDIHSIDVLDGSPFQDFKFKCIGEPVDLIREGRLAIIDKKKKGKQLTFRYDPTGKPTKIPEYIFDNVSGNEVINKKNLIIKI